ncbi:MAG: peptidylprolyl isomerase [Bacteroidales bacterium]|nr:peptidylprolyl isomerase [Candidatus Cryptobacteroides caccocaballi]
MRRIIPALLACSLIAVACHNQTKATDENEAADQTEVQADEVGTGVEEPVYDIVTNMGTIKIKLYKKTPKHRENFEKLVAEHFYDSLLFHRVINGFMIQGGDPYTRDTSKVDLYGQGGPGYTVPAEFVNEYYHKKGAIAAARIGDRANPKKASSGSQFYIVQDEMNCLQLDGEYTIFGETISGLDVIDRIASVPTDYRDRPVRDVRIITVKPDTKANEQPAE